MCGRFYVDDIMLNEIHKICKKIDESYHHRSGDIRPSEKALIIKKDIDNELCAIPSAWGYQLKEGKQLLINARVETIHQKPTFRDDYKHHRCVIPASGFYEWDHKKEKYRCIPKQNQKILYLAGIYSEKGGESRFTIITTKANEIMNKVHERMPIVLQGEQVTDWLIDKSEINSKESSFFELQHISKGEKYQELSFLE